MNPWVTLRPTRDLAPGAAQRSWSGSDYRRYCHRAARRVQFLQACARTLSKVDFARQCHQLGVQPPCLLSAAQVAELSVPSSKVLGALLSPREADMIGLAYIRYRHGWKLLAESHRLQGSTGKQNCARAGLRAISDSMDLLLDAVGNTRNRQGARP